jgi:hypothetical protein
VRRGIVGQPPALSPQFSRARDRRITLTITSQPQKMPAALPISPARANAKIVRKETP